MSFRISSYSPAARRLVGCSGLLGGYAVRTGDAHS